jgi:hypothetical protein
VVMAVHVAFMLVVAVLCTKDGWAHRTRKVLDVIFAVERCDVGTA